MVSVCLCLLKIIIVAKCICCTMVSYLSEAIMIVVVHPLEQATLSQSLMYIGRIANEQINLGQTIKSSWLW